MYASRDTIEALYDETAPAHLYRLARCQFVFLYRLAEGRSLASIAEELEKAERTLYVWRKILVRQFKAEHFEQVMFIFGKLMA